MHIWTHDRETVFKLITVYVLKIPTIDINVKAHIPPKNGFALGA